MPKFRVTATAYITKYLGEVEAETAEAACEMLNNEAYITLCHQCSAEHDVGDCDKVEAEPCE